MAELPNNNQPTPEDLERIEAEKDAAFKVVVQKIKEAEESGELKSAHLKATNYDGGVNVEELTREDRKMWEKVESGTPYEGEFREEYARYIKEVEGDAAKKKETQESGHTSRQNFQGYLGNRISIVAYEKSIKEEEEEKKKS